MKEMQAACLFQRMILICSNCTPRAVISPSAHARSLGTVARPGLSDVVPARLLDTEHHSLALL